MNANELIDAEGLIQTDLFCDGCGYNLRALPSSGRCPECSLPVIHSTVPDSLRSAPRFRLAILFVGLTLHNCGTIALVFTLFAAMRSPVLWILSLSAWAGGMWTLTICPNEAQRPKVPAIRASLFVRLASLLSAGAGFVAAAVSSSPASSPGFPLTMTLISAIAWYVAEFSASEVSIGLARLIPNAPLAEFIAWTRKFSVFGPVPLLLIFVTDAVTELASYGRLHLIADYSAISAWILGLAALTTFLWLWFSLVCRFQLARSVRRVHRLPLRPR